MSRYWSDVVSRLTPYVPGEQPRVADLVKLNTNESPYGPSPKVLAAIRDATADTLRLYPDPESERVKQAVAACHGVTPAEVFVGNGSDEVLAFAFLALLKHREPVLFPDVTYSFYPVYCALFGIEHAAVPLTAAFAIRVDDYLRPNGGIVFPNPNAPTGCPVARGDVERLLAANRGSAVVIDEAYVDFGGESSVPLVARHANLLVVHTMSKSRSLAGLRVGYAIGHPDLVEALQRVKNSFNSYPLDRLAIAGAVAALEDRDHFESTRSAIIASRARLVRGLEGLGMEVLPSVANFVFARHPSRGGAELAQALRARGILVRHFAQPRIDRFLRITVGSDAQCAALIGALRAILA